MALWKVVFGIIVYFAVPSLAQKNGEDFLLEIPQGRLLGEWRTSFGGKPYAAFEGVPYARPPVGDLRFRDPQKAEKWNGLLLAKTHPNVCSQWTQKYEDAVGSEDCLFVNVYSPNPSGNKLPVIVYIHGGAFVYGTSNTYKPDFLLDNQVIYVSLQYRLGVLGFMSTQDAVLPGNLGLKDQSMALRWVKDNIRHFGGDPDRITITGMSAGGASVHLHLLNPQSKGLFRNAISMSGTALCPWVLQEAPLQKSRLVASNLGCPTDNSEAMVDCLRKRPAADVVKTIAHLTVYQFAPFSPWAPVVEPTVDGAFLTVHPYETVLKGLAIDVPWIVSITSEEGLYPAAIYVEKPEYLEHISKEWNTLAPHIYDFNYTLSLDKHSEAAQKIKDYYFGGKDLSMETFSKFIDSLTHRHFSVDAEKTARLQAVRGSSPVYYYHFAYRGATSMSDGKSNSKVNYGVSHGDDTGYVINVNYQDPTTTAQDREMIKVMTKMWVSFAQNGTPNIGIKWLPIAMTQDLLYLAIESPTKIGMKVSYYTKDDALDFWTSLGLDENDNFVRKRVKDEL